MTYKTGNIYPPQGTKIEPKRRQRVDKLRKLNALFLALTNKVRVKIK